MEEERRKNHIVIFGLEENINEHYIDIQEVETKFVTDNGERGQWPILAKIHSLCEKDVNFIVFIPCIIDN